MKRLVSFPAKTIFLFGLATILMGVVGLFVPQVLLDILGFPFDLAQTGTFMMAASQASVAVGLYYILNALRGDRQFFVYTCYIRALNTVVFTLMVLFQVAPVGWLMVAGYEAAGAVFTAVALARTPAA